ncbi:chorismate lyase [Rheinheimera sp. F8]|uniref:chorismate--pyruvate lyase family protein n=1 Tax=Rheinheimera sp. F8 TaxID=1763998 RepID=UPI000744AA1E|nr:chorismate lyase [Rheinheimera sp. F8]ALZ75654.1 hypothetical protein ATY27_07720 [Rheinheimera sp. F8]
MIDVDMAPIWQANWSEHKPEGITPIWLDWLLEAGSLTARLQRTGRAFSLHLVRQQDIELPAFLQQRWQTRHGLLREVVLLLDQQPCIYAQSFLPDHTVLALQPLAMLGAVPLGHYIFTQPELSRSTIEIAEFAEGLQLPGLGVLPQLWGRRSYFTLSQHELLVQELYLPALTEFI